MKAEIHLYSTGKKIFTYVILSRRILLSRLKKNWYFLPDGWDYGKTRNFRVAEFFIRFLHLITYSVAIFLYIHYLYIAIPFLRQTILPTSILKRDSLLLSIQNHLLWTKLSMPQTMTIGNMPCNSLDENKTVLLPSN